MSIRWAGGEHLRWVDLELQPPVEERGGEDGAVPSLATRPPTLDTNTTEVATPSLPPGPPAPEAAQCPAHQPTTQDTAVLLSQTLPSFLGQLE